MKQRSVGSSVRAVIGADGQSVHSEPSLHISTLQLCASFSFSNEGSSIVHQREYLTEEKRFLFLSAFSIPGAFSGIKERFSSMNQFDTFSQNSDF